MSTTLITNAGHPEAPTLSDQQREFIAWVQLQVDKNAAEAVRMIMIGQVSTFKNVSIVDEHRVRQEARKRNIPLNHR